MRSRFPLGKISAFGKLVTGKTPPSKIEDAFGGDIPFITPRDMDGRRLLETTERYLSQSGVRAVKNSLIPADSVVVSCIGSDMGKVGVTSRPSVTNQQINAVIVDKEKYLPEYLYYALLPRKSELRAAAGGTTMPILNKSNFGEFELPIPSFDDQLRIVNTVRPLDKKIELNTRMNQTLEKIAQRIFKSWFIDFDPVKANAEGVPFADLSPDIQSLFPSEFVESEMGLIPKGWEVKKISELGEVVTGKTPSTKKIEYYGSDVPFITIPDMHGGIFVTKVNKYLSEAGRNSQSKKDIPKGSIMVSCIATPGLVSIAHEVCHTNQQINSLIPKKNFQYFYLNSLQAISSKNAFSKGGTVFDNMNKTDFSNIEVLVANDEILDAFENIVTDLYARILHNKKNNDVLSILRDKLLPKLLSGSIEINDDIEEQIAEAS